MALPLLAIPVIGGALGLGVGGMIGYKSVTKTQKAIQMVGVGVTLFTAYNLYTGKWSI